MSSQSPKVDYKYIYESFPDMCLSLETSTGKILSFNKTLLDTLGYTAEEVSKATLFDLYAESEKEKVQANLNSIRNNQVPENSEFVVRKKNGELLDVTLKLSFVRDNSGNVLYSNAVWRDISDLKNVQRELTAEKKKVETQNKLISEQNKNFTDAISYAKKIQDGMLPTTGEINNNFPNHFVYYQPKGIVSGDFYWIHERGDQVLFSVVDCTGHGVPGALMSMAGAALFDQVVVEQEILCAEIIMNKIRAGIIKSLKQGQSDSTNSDGMDAAFCVYNKKTGMLEFSGANNSLVVVRDKGDSLLNEKEEEYPVYIEDDTFSLYEIKGQRQPLGYYFGMGTLFCKKQVQLKEGDRIFLYTDGYQDQIGGKKGKKYLSKRFKKELLEGVRLSTNEQYSKLVKSHEGWKGDAYEQTDDICIWGIQL